MPNKGKKGKRKKNSRNHNGPTVVRPLLLKEDGQEYAVVLKLLGDRRMTIKCYDGVERLGRIRGNMRKRCWIAPGDHVLISMRDFTEKCVDIFHKFNDDEVKRMKKSGILVDIGIAIGRNDDVEEEPAEDEAFTFEDI